MKIIRNTVCLLVFSGFFSYSFSQEIVCTLEAENAVLTPPAKVKYVNTYSNGAYVGDNDPGSAIVFRNVSIPEEGTYEFRTTYTSMHIRSIAVKSGIFPPVTVTAPETTEDWNRPPVAVMVTYIYLNKGGNTIAITPHNGGGPNIDKFEIVKTSVSMPRPEPLNPAFEYDLTDDALVTSNRTATDVDKLTDNDISTVYTFNESSAVITVACDMPYLLTGYLFSAGNESSADVKNWKMEYSADGNAYSVINPSTAADLPGSVLFEIGRNPHSDRSKAAKYYRITAYDGKIGEIQLFGIPCLSNTDNKNFPVDMTDGINISEKTLGEPLGVSGSFDERYYNLFDRDMSRKYYWHSAASFWVDVELENRSTLHYYTLTSCQDYPERDPKSWVLEGFDGDWEMLDEVSGFTFPTRYATMKFYIEDKKPYKGYRLRVTQNNGAEAFQLLKWQLFGNNSASFTPALYGDKEVTVFISNKELVVKAEENGTCRVYSLSGRLAASCRMNGIEQRFSLEPGIYIVKLLTAGKNYVKKIIVR
ncbi:MAG: T9SS type A sorting domain-containing protein [Dysgonamonadaceae bacterium]|jgi:hypothetical protein|nr:T9SS type A sorting domain-containing protein [Dysgonamonadaceae bacterium]